MRKSINGLNSETYPPPYVAGSPDLQALVYRCLFQNNGRLKLLNPKGSKVLFGDVLRRQQAPARGAEAASAVKTVSEDEILDVFVVMTSACDLQRLSTQQLLLLKGRLLPLTPAVWSYKETPVRTPVYEIAPDKRFQIEWDLKHIETFSRDHLDELLAAPDGFRVVARLREARALELQQKLLSNLGRVGLIAHMPATFPVKIEVYLPNPSKKLFKIAVPALTATDAVCFIGRKEGKPAKTLVLCEDACEALCEAIQSLPLETVHPTTKDTIVGLRASGELLILQKGVDFSDVTDQRFCEIESAPTARAEKSEEKHVIGLIRRNGPWMDTPLNGSYLKKAGVILVVMD